eukprot:TRINITY_DN43318_c0_g1_i1.p1 TRINITY_DN43318_c0_g1~~TRINITY_DN43318_c0_g1_i1.p1  ORF type:complete len:628 (-),score=112.63 TRINITY_DN43318_c0_g1_i1:141-1934(-)
MALAAAKARLEEEEESGQSAAMAALLGSNTSANPARSSCAESCAIGNDGANAGTSTAEAAVGTVTQNVAKQEETPATVFTKSSGTTGAVHSNLLRGDFILVMSQVLPDGLGDLIFGENAVHELARKLPVAWVRCYQKEESVAAGERLIAKTAASCVFGFVCSNQRDLLSGGAGTVTMEEVWSKARECFLAPWIFGLSTHEDELLDLVTRTRKSFWALTEYGRGMGNIYTYTGGLASMIPTGWPASDNTGGVFRSILSAPSTETDWRTRCAEFCGLGSVDPVNIRLWWFYSRKDDEKKHDFRILGDDTSVGNAASVGGVAFRRAAKIVPVDSGGNIALGHEKTSGEKLADQLFQVASDPNYKPKVDVSCAEVSAGIAGQLSQFLWAILFEPVFTKRLGKDGSRVIRDETATVDIIVAPNVLTRLREEGARTASAGNADTSAAVAVAQIAQLDLVSADGSLREMPLEKGRQVFVCSTRVPRQEMRTFLEQCEDPVFTTGDQSLAEAMFMDKVPCIKPDAKVQQWQLALNAKAQGLLHAVPDLGAILRGLVEDESARERARQASRLRSDSIQKQMETEIGMPPRLWNPTQWVLAKAGMLG